MKRKLLPVAGASILATSLLVGCRVPNGKGCGRLG